ncbi:MAG: flagellar hook-associated protein FlgL [Syntrophales bacterium]|jgi:flagellar hook-associated protein 3 FlgL
MITRVTNQMMTDLLNNSMSTVDTQYYNSIEEMSSGKQINSPSDNPIGFGQILSYRSGLAQISNYQQNISSNNSWLSATESALTQVNDILTSIKTTAISQANATASASTRQDAADSLQQQIEQILSLANSQSGNSYIFAGTSTDAAPFSATARSATEYTVTPASENTYSSTVDTSGGTYSGNVNNAYVIKIVQGGTLGTATYEVSSDGGKTWGNTQTMPASGSIAIGDGMNLTFPAGTFAANDVFTVNAYAAGYYNGNGAELSNEVNNGVTSNYSITGEEAFTDQQGNGTVDIFTVLNQLQTALQNNDTTGITNSLDSLTSAGDQITRYIAQCGTRENSLTTAGNVLTDMNTQLTTDNSNIEDADVATLETTIQQQQLALEAIYKTASDVESMSILNFLQ